MIINFPVWFSFATALLFHREGSQDYLSETLSKEITADALFRWLKLEKIGTVALSFVFGNYCLIME
jgi:hypothetical protein